MKKKILDILSDVYAVEPKLRKHERQLIKIVEELQKAKPDTKFDQRFAVKLRGRLLSQLARSEVQPQTVEASDNKLISFTFMRKFSYLAGGALIAVLIIIPAVYFTNFGSKIAVSPVSIGSDQKISRLSENAFGSLQSQDERILAAAMSDSVAAGFGGGGGGLATEGMAVPAPGIYPYPFYRDEYVYTGEPLELAVTQMEVFQRSLKNVQGGAGQLLSKLNFGLINFNSLTDPQLRHVTFSEDSADGYTVTMSLDQGVVSMYREGPFVEFAQNELMKPDDIPADDALIRVADSFLKQHGISTKFYGEPVVNNDWRIAFARDDRPEQFAAPQIMQVTYPLSINETDVYDQGGNSVGLMAMVSVTEMKVISVNNIAIQQYESSLYDVKTDIDTLLENFVNRRGEYPDSAQVEVRTIELGTPELALSVIYYFNEGRGAELYVPAFVFPVVKKPDSAQFLSDVLVTPLTTDLLQPMMGATGGGALPLLEVQAEVVE